MCYIHLLHETVNMLIFAKNQNAHFPLIGHFAQNANDCIVQKDGNIPCGKDDLANMTKITYGEMSFLKKSENRQNVG